MEKDKADTDLKHHPWCNYFNTPTKGCKLCARLFKEYPVLENMTSDELAKKYFPNVTKISN